MQDAKSDETQSPQIKDLVPYTADKAADANKDNTASSAQETTPVTPRPATVWPPLPGSHRRRAGLPTPVIVFVIVLVVVLIASGMGFIIYSTTNQYQTSLHHLESAEIQLTANVTNTAQANIQALNTAQANIDATATSQANDSAQATETVDNATATASALNDLYTSSTDGTPVFDDPLSDNTGAGSWQVGNPSKGTGCSFTNSVYQASEGQLNFFQPCIAQKTRFSSFAYQVQVTISQGNLGQVGLIFRINSSNKAYYFFHIGTDGSYALDLYQGNNPRTLSSGFNSAITPGVGQSNLLAVVANSNMLYLFANGQYLASVTDSSLTAGKIGVGVIDRSTPVVAQFTDAQVWDLSSSADQPSSGLLSSPTPGLEQTPTLGQSPIVP